MGAEVQCYRASSIVGDGRSTNGGGAIGIRANSVYTDTEVRIASDIDDAGKPVLSA